MKRVTSIAMLVVAVSVGMAGTLTLLRENSAQAASTQAVFRIPAPAFQAPEAGKRETAVFAGGCFWGVQGVFQHVRGVSSAVSGYAGGDRGSAKYAVVSRGGTGHAEAVKVTYDPRQVSYGQLLHVFFSVVADPTMLNAQGPDRGTQYRSALFPQSPGQRETAERYIAQLGKAGAWKRPIVTRVEPFKGFYAAEAYHQDYLTLHPDSAYIRRNDLPKVAALKATFPALYRINPVLVSGPGTSSAQDR
ncbi:peptide-methionine (S)-S-oxide reductase MsrA [Novosphingobium guangzhouense]|uniref:Peptide methionine sulfoxide reductase MsrA n=1 Tax=Novosphingobium guangzhouense TaxID=1850347 RepID=A0A2K2FTH0_9SPHN|nr:peptide-methionine (S)-S-oxide reductase MsrA [Novosphingobium guangzhouense]PNU02083.1 peptide-methionine (S)-S-oxide reductase [Novosphingobium guangzhouense]